MNKQRDIAIKIEQVRKCYRLGVIGGRTLQEELQSWWAEKRGKEDPNICIGTDARQIGKEFWALNGIDLTIYRGESVGIIGGNGAGKSTLLNLLSRITAPTEGEIDIWGRISSLLEIGTGFHRELTGRENIYMNGAILGMTRAEIDAKIEKIIEFSEIKDFIDTPVKRYSSGMYVKLGFAVAAFLDSEIFIMDEVLAVGDMAFQKKCLDKMRESADKERKTILYVSHNMDTIRRLCERCIVLEQGKIIFDGDVERGISLYLNKNLDENLVDVELENKQENKNAPITLQHLLLQDKVMPVYMPEEALILRLTMNVTKPIANLLLRLTFRNEADVAIGTAWSHPFSMLETGVCDMDFKIPLIQIAKGKFFVSLGIYRTDETGKKKPLAHITRAFKIEIQGLPLWNVRAHGFVHFSEIEIREIKTRR